MSSYRRVDGAVSAEVDGQTVIVSPVDRRYFALNATGNRIWELIPSAEGVTIDDLVAALTAEFSVDAERCRADVAAQIDRLVDAGLVGPA